VHCSFITLLWYGCFRSSSKVLAPMRVKEIPQEQPLRRPQHLRHIPITVHMRIRVKRATTRRGARNTLACMFSERKRRMMCLCWTDSEPGLKAMLGICRVRLMADTLTGQHLATEGFECTRIRSTVDTLISQNLAIEYFECTIG
jgi:hypothetical protein